MAIFQCRSLQWCFAHQPVPRKTNKCHVSSYLTHSTLNMQWHRIKCPRKMYVPTKGRIESLRSLHLHEYKFAIKLRISSVQWAVYFALTMPFDSSSPVQRTKVSSLLQCFYMVLIVYYIIYNAGCNKDHHPYIGSTTLMRICGCRSATLKLNCAYIHICSFLYRVNVSNYFVPLPLSSATLDPSVKDNSMVAMSFSQCLSNLRVDPPSLFTFDTSRASARACAAGWVRRGSNTMTKPPQSSLLYIPFDWLMGGWVI